MTTTPLNSAEPIDQALESENNHFENLLASALSRIAAIQGYAVPSHRFLMSSMNLHGATIKKLSPDLQAREIWLTFFSNGQILI